MHAQAIVVLFNLLAPVGWTVGLLRIEDVAIGCAVSFAVGVLFWPRGVSAVVADDLADSFRASSRSFRRPHWPGLPCRGIRRAMRRARGISRHPRINCRTRTCSGYRNTSIT